MNKKIFVVDDDEMLRKSVVEFLHNDNFQTIEADNGIDALRIAQEQQPGLIILDLAMPGLDGLSALKKLRESGDYGSQVPVILLTSLEPDDTINAYIAKTNPAYYLVKSQVSKDEIVSKVKEVLGA